MRYPYRNTSTTQGSAPLSLQGCQWRDRVRQGDGSYFRKPKGPEEGADPLPTRERLRLLNLEAEEERLRRCWPWRKAPEVDAAARGEEVERPLPLSSDLDMARLEDISDDCCTWDTTTSSISSSNRRLSEPGDTVRARRCVSGTGISVCASKNHGA